MLMQRPVFFEGKDCHSADGNLTLLSSSLKLGEIMNSRK
jgi:hypothetical protein